MLLLKPGLPLHSKFFNRPNGSKPEPQQSKLSFSSKPQVKKEPTVEEEEPVEDEEGASTESAPVDDDGDLHMKDEESQSPEEVVNASSEADDGDAAHDSGTFPPSVLAAIKTHLLSHTADMMKLRSGNQAFAVDTPSTPQHSKKRPAEADGDESSYSDVEQPKNKRRKKPTHSSAKTSPQDKPKAKPKKSVKFEEPELAKISPKGKRKTKAEPKPKDTNGKAERVKQERSKVVKEVAAKPTRGKAPEPVATTEVVEDEEDSAADKAASEAEEQIESDEDEKPEVVAKAREKVQSTLKAGGKDPYPDWKDGDPVPFAALCTTFSKVEMTTKRLEILAHCSLFLRQVLRLTPTDLLPTVQLMINKLAADYAGIELGIGESLIMKAIGEATGRSLNIIKADQNEIGDLGLVAAKSRSTQPTMFKPKPLTVRGVHEGLMAIATTTEGSGAQGRKIAGIKKLLSAADAHLAGKGSKGVDITKDKGGPSEMKYIVRALEGKMRLGLADKTVLVALAQAMVFHEVSQNGDKIPSTAQLAEGETILKSVYR